MDYTPAERQRGGSLQPHRPSAVSEDVVDAEIDRDVDDSFPASDPPGWTLGIEVGYGQPTPAATERAGQR